MRQKLKILSIAALLVFGTACATAHKAQPLPFRAPASYANAVRMAGATLAAEAFSEPEKAKEAFGFDVRGAGMLPVEIIFDNEGPHTFEINPAQTRRSVVGQRAAAAASRNGPGAGAYLKNKIIRKKE